MNHSPHPAVRATITNGEVERNATCDHEAHIVRLTSIEIHLSDDEGLVAGHTSDKNYFGDGDSREEYFLWPQHP